MPSSINRQNSTDGRTQHSTTTRLQQNMTKEPAAFQDNPGHPSHQNLHFSQPVLPLPPPAMAYQIAERRDNAGTDDHQQDNAASPVGHVTEQLAA